MESNLLPNSQPFAHRARRSAVSVLLAAGAFSSACATFVNGPTQRVAVVSDPPGAQVYVNGAPVDVTPAFVDVPRRDPDLELRLEKDGYEPTVLALKRWRSAWLAANVLFAGVPINDYGLEAWFGAMAVYGVLGSLHDVRSGGAYKRPELVRATLERIGSENDATVRSEHEPPQPARVIGAPHAPEAKPRNRLMPMQLTDKVQRLTSRWSGWNALSERRTDLRRP